MPVTPSESMPVWTATTDWYEPAPLQASADVEVCVVGAGIAGLSTAYLLAREGRSVLVIDDGAVGSGETHHTTAHLSNALDDRYDHLERVIGREGAQLAAESHTAAIDRIESIVAAEAIDCDFERLDGYLVTPPGEPADVLKRERDAACRNGIAAELVEGVPIGSYDFGAALRFPGQGQFHPLKYVNGLARAVERLGGRVHCGNHATAIEGGARPKVETAQGAIGARAVVVATNSPVSDRLAIHTKQAPYRTYAIGARVRSGALPHLLLWDTLDPYHYVRMQPGTNGDYLIVGGEDHKTGQADDYAERFVRLEQWTRERFPIEEVRLRWSGQVMEPDDGMAFIGRDPGSENVYVVTGDSGHGMTHATIAGMLITDLILGRENAWAKLYDPSRKPMHALGPFSRENANVARQYLDHLKRGEVRSEDDIGADEGAILRHGMHQQAIFRDSQGTLHRHSAVCTHLGCIVHWNPAAKSWDCPCHGSRYDPRDGSVLNGPAIDALKPVDK